MKCGGAGQGRASWSPFSLGRWSQRGRELSHPTVTFYTGSHTYTAPHPTRDTYETDAYHVTYTHPHTQKHTHSQAHRHTH